MQRYINSQYSVFVDPTQAYANNSFQETKQIASVLFSLFFWGGHFVLYKDKQQEGEKSCTFRSSAEISPHSFFLGDLLNCKH